MSYTLHISAVGSQTLKQVDMYIVPVYIRNYVIYSLYTQLIFVYEHVYKYVQMYVFIV